MGYPTPTSIHGRRTPGTGRQRPKSDARYRSYRWRAKTRPFVLARDRWRCWVTGCERKANVVDHIDRVTALTTDAEFFDMTRLRASCNGHNLARGHAGPGFDIVASSVVVKDYQRARRKRSQVIVKDYGRGGAIRDDPY